MSQPGASGRSAPNSSSGRSSLTGKLLKGLGTAAVQIVGKRLPREPSTLGHESARTIAATRIQAMARGMLVRRRLPVRGYLQLYRTRFPHIWCRRFVSLELSTATLVWCRHPSPYGMRKLYGNRRLGAAVARWARWWRALGAGARQLAAVRVCWPCP